MIGKRTWGSVEADGRNNGDEGATWHDAEAIVRRAGEASGLRVIVSMFTRGNMVESRDVDEVGEVRWPFVTVLYSNGNRGSKARLLWNQRKVHEFRMEAVLNKLRFCYDPASFWFRDTLVYRRYSSH